METNRPVSNQKIKLKIKEINCLFCPNDCFYFGKEVLSKSSGGKVERGKEYMDKSIRKRLKEIRLTDPVKWTIMPERTRRTRAGQ